jgi:hypothetical protein
LENQLVTNTATAAITKAGGNVKVLLPHVLRQMRMKKDAAGNYLNEIVNDQGQPRVGDNQGAPMTADQLVEEMKGLEDFAGCFKGSGASGSGAGDGNSNTETSKTGVLRIKASDKALMSKHVDDIATGKAVVVEG